MTELIEIFINSQKYSSWSKQRLSVIIEQCSYLSFDWDRECGERWASIELNDKFVGYISSFIPLCFCKIDSLEDIIKVFGDEVYIVAEDDFDKKKWFIDEEKIKANLNELSWIVQEGMLDLKRFSINDLWYATI